MKFCLNTITKIKEIKFTHEKDFGQVFIIEKIFLLFKGLLLDILSKETIEKTVLYNKFSNAGHYIS